MGTKTCYGQSQGTEFFLVRVFPCTQPVITFSKLTVELLKHGVKYVQSYQ